MAAVPVLGELVAEVGPRRVVPVKGIVTARTLYRDPAERALRDIDVRVADDATLDELIAYARARGYGVRDHVPSYRTAVLEMHGVDVDVECTVGAPGLCGLEVSEILRRAQIRDDVFGFPCAIPDVHDHALVLAVNVFKDKISLAQPWQFEDVIRIAEQPSFDPSRFVELARETRSLAIACVIAEWLAPRSGGWRAVRERMGPRPPRLAYARVLRWLFVNAPESMAARVLARLASDDPAMRVRALAVAVRYLQERK
jgi:hypothetical protein